PDAHSCPSTTLFRSGEADHVGFNPAGPRGMFSVSRSGLLAYRPSTVRELSWFDRTGRLLGRIGVAGRDSEPALSPDGARVAVSRDRKSTRLNSSHQI